MALIQVNNFQRVQEVKINVQGLTLVKGESNNGKSSFVRALHAACFNRFSPSHIRFGTGYAQVMIRWEQGGDVLKIVRAPAGSPKMQLGKKEFTKIGMDVPEEVESYNNLGVLKVGDKIHTLHFHFQYTPPVLLKFSQKKIMEMLSASPAMDDYNKAYKQFLLNRTKNTGAFESIDRLLSEEKAKLSIISGLLREVEPIVAECARVQAALVGLREKDVLLQSCVNNLVKFEERNKQLITLKELQLSEDDCYNNLSRSFSIKEQLTKLANSIKKETQLNSVKDNILRKLSCLDNLYEVLCKKDSLSALREALVVNKTLLDKDVVGKKSFVERLSVIIDTVSNIKMELLKLENSKSECALLQGEFSSYLFKKKRLEELKDVIESNKCPICGSKL